jgi:hypothetical protein
MAKNLQKTFVFDLQSAGRFGILMDIRKTKGKGNTMRFMPDSAVLGTIGHAKRRAAKARRRGHGGYDFTDVIPTLAGGIGLMAMLVAVALAYVVLA